MNKKISLELLWWVITAMLTIAILYPMISMGNYEFLWSNVFLIVTFVTLTRYIFLLPQTLLAGIEWAKAALILVAPILIFLLIQEINRFQTFLDKFGWEAVITNEGAIKQKGLSKYIYTEMLFFGVGGVISAFLFPVRMVISIWRVRNLGRE